MENDKVDLKQDLTIDRTVELTSLIIETAKYQMKCAPVGATSLDLKITPDSIRDAANLVFLALGLIAERKP